MLTQVKESQNYFRDWRIQPFHFLDRETEVQRGDMTYLRPQLANDRAQTQTKLGLSFNHNAKSPVSQTLPGSYNP